MWESLLENNVKVARAGLTRTMENKIIQSMSYDLKEKIGITALDPLEQLDMTKFRAAAEALSQCA